MNDHFWDRLRSIGDCDERVDFILEQIDEAVTRGSFDDIERMFESADVDELTITDMVCIASYTMYNRSPVSNIIDAVNTGLIAPMQRYEYVNRPTFLNKLKDKLIKEGRDPASFNVFR